jgi:hypothetical protein
MLRILCRIYLTDSEQVNNLADHKDYHQALPPYLVPHDPKATVNDKPTRKAPVSTPRGVTCSDKIIYDCEAAINELDIVSRTLEYRVEVPSS